MYILKDFYPSTELGDEYIMDVVCEPETAKEMDQTKLKHYTNAEINLFHPLFVKLNTVSWASSRPRMY